MFAPGAPRGGAGWANEVERWLLFGCRNSQERSNVTVREGPGRQFRRPQVYRPGHSGGRAVACDRDGRLRPGACSGSGPATLAPRRACTAPGRMDTSTQRRDFAADSLQMQRGAIAAAIRDCGRSTGQGYRGYTTTRKSRVALPAMRVLSRLDVRPTKKYTSALS